MLDKLREWAIVVIATASVTLLTASDTPDLANVTMAALIVVMVLLGFLAFGASTQMESARVEFTQHLKPLRRASEQLDRAIESTAEIRGLLTVEEAAQLERDLEPGSRITIINPSQEIEFDLALLDGERFVDIVEQNITKGVRYVYLVPKSEQLDFAERVGAQIRGAEIIAYPSPEGDGGDALLLSKALAVSTVTLYSSDSEEKCRAIITTPGFEQGYAIEISQQRTAQIRQAVNEYVSHLRARHAA